MSARFKTAMQFVAEWLRLATVGGSVTERIAKAVTFVVLTVFALGADSRIRFVFVSPFAGGAKEMPLPWDIPVGIVVLVFIAAMWLAIAFGITHVRFVRLEIAKSLEKENLEPYYRLRIRNLGWAELEIEIRVTDVATNDGACEDARSRMPVVLSWEDCDEGRRRLSKGHWYKVNVASIIRFREQDSLVTSIAVSFIGAGRRSVNGGKVRVEEPLWFRLTFGDNDTARWFSITAHGDASQCTTTSGVPPFLSRA